MKRILLITSEITPYRKFFYDSIYEYSKEKGFEFKVLLMTRLEFGYFWDSEKLMMPYMTLMKGFHFKKPVSMHVNLGVNKYIKDYKPNLIIFAGSYMAPTLWLGLSYCKFKKIPSYFWSESHLNEHRTYSKVTLMLRERLRSLIYKNFNGFWYAGKLSRQFIEKYSNTKAKFHFVPNLIENEKYFSIRKSKQNDNFKKQLNLPLNNKVIIIPARLSEVKGLHLFLPLIDKIPLHSNITILIAGEGPQRRELEQLISSLKTDIRLLGQQDQASMLLLYAISDFFVLPSLSDPNPLTCIEALWCGLPLFVSSHVGNFPETIVEGINGFVFNYDDKNDLISKFKKFVDSSDNWQEEASLKSLEIAKTIYNPELVVKQLLDNMLYSASN